MPLLIGGGKMGGALLQGWVDRGIDASQITVIEPDGNLAASHRELLGVNVLTGPEELAGDFQTPVIVFAVKPQAMEAVVPAYARFAGPSPIKPGCVFLSIAAGKTLAFFETHLGAGAAVVRAMPNTPAAVGRGISVLCANGAVTEDQKTDCQDLMEAVGEAAWIDDEALMDAVTAVSGSGPAYVFLLAECMAEAGMAAGLPEALARRLAGVTVSGSGELMRLAAESPATLRQNVTSPGGTTSAALDVLMGADGLCAILRRAVAAAARRSKELAG